MENTFQIFFHLMGDPAVRSAWVSKSSSSEWSTICHINMPDGFQKIAMTLGKGEWIQTEGVPLDSNTCTA